MKRSRTVICALLVISASSALIAPAVASAGKIGTSESYPANLTGSQVGENVFKIENDTLELKCPVVTASGLISAESESVTGVTGEAKGEGEKTCKAFGLNATVGGGCTGTFKVGTEKEKEMKFEGTADVVCSSGEVITIVTATCEVQIGAQTGLGPVNFEVMTNTAATKNDVTVNPAISKKIAYKETKDGIGCPLTHLNEARTDGSFTGTNTVKGENTETKAEKELFLK